MEQQIYKAARTPENLEPMGRWTEIMATSPEEAAIKAFSIFGYEDRYLRAIKLKEFNFNLTHPDDVETETEQRAFILTPQNQIREFVLFGNGYTYEHPGKDA